MWFENIECMLKAEKKFPVKFHNTYTSYGGSMKIYVI